MDISAVTGEYNTGSCCDLRKPMRLTPCRKMRPSSPALRAEPYCFPNQTRKELHFVWLNSRESPRTLSQGEKNTDVTSGTPNSSVFPKSNWDEASFPCIGSIDIPRSTLYRTSGLTTFMKLQRFPEKPVTRIEAYQFQYSNLRKVTCNPYHLGMRMIPSPRLKR